MALVDYFAGNQGSMTSPASRLAEVTPSDEETLGVATKGLYIGTGGDVSVVSLRGDEVVFKNVPDGALLPIRVRKVNATGTDATDIVALG